MRSMPELKGTLEECVEAMCGSRAPEKNHLGTGDDKARRGPAGRDRAADVVDAQRFRPVGATTSSFVPSSAH